MTVRIRIRQNLPCQVTTAPRNSWKYSVSWKVCLINDHDLNVNRSCVPTVICPVIIHEHFTLPCVFLLHQLSFLHSSNCWPSFLLLLWQATLGKRSCLYQHIKQPASRALSDTRRKLLTMNGTMLTSVYTQRSTFVHCDSWAHNPSNLKLDWTSEPIYAGLPDVWFDYCGELPAVFALESWPLTKNTHTENTFPSFQILISEHSCEWRQLDSESKLADYTE